MIARRYIIVSSKVKLFGLASSWRCISSSSIRDRVTTSHKEHSNSSNELWRRILKFVPSPDQSAAKVISDWIDGGHRVAVSELRQIYRLLVKRRRQELALDILTWMAQHTSAMSAADHAMRLELIIKLRSLEEAEEYFANLPNTISWKASCLLLLRCYVRERAIERAEALMQRMSCLGLIVSSHPFNEMMKLYIATSQYEKALSVIALMKQNKIPRTVLSYNLWMNACAELLGVKSVERVYREMTCDKEVEIGWSSLATLADIYRKSGNHDKAMLALSHAEKKLSLSNRLGYFFLITLHSSLNNKNGVLRLWEASKAVEGRITCSNYMCILLSLVKLGDIQEAESIFKEWESQCKSYDIRVSNILLGAYMRNGLTEKAELLHLHTLRRGGSPNYKTWEILMEGWVNSQQMDKAIDAMNKCLDMSRHCNWRPSLSILVAIAEYYEKSGHVEDGRSYLGVIRPLGFASLPIYKSLLRMHSLAQVPAQDIVKTMLNDGIQLDNEACTLIGKSLR